MVSISNSNDAICIITADLDEQGEGDYIDNTSVASCGRYCMKDAMCKCFVWQTGSGRCHRKNFCKPVPAPGQGLVFGDCREAEHQPPCHRRPGSYEGRGDGSHTPEGRGSQRECGRQCRGLEDCACFVWEQGLCYFKKLCSPVEEHAKDLAFFDCRPPHPTKTSPSSHVPLRHAAVPMTVENYGLYGVAALFGAVALVAAVFLALFRFSGRFRVVVIDANRGEMATGRRGWRRVALKVVIVGGEAVGAGGQSGRLEVVPQRQGFRADRPHRRFDAELLAQGRLSAPPDRLPRLLPCAGDGEAEEAPVLPCLGFCLRRLALEPRAEEDGGRSSETTFQTKSRPSFSKTKPCLREYILVTAYAEGGSLDHFLRQSHVRNHLTTRTILRIGLQMSEAQQFLQRKGLVHMDIKPDNFVVRSGKGEGEGGEARVLLADYGLARRCSLAEGQAYTGQGEGHRLYRAPELCLRLPGKDQRYGFETDVWSVGLSIWEAWTYCEARALGFGAVGAAASLEADWRRQLRRSAKWSADQLRSSLASGAPPLLPGHPLLFALLRGAFLFRPAARLAEARLSERLAAALAEWAEEELAKSHFFRLPGVDKELAPFPLSSTSGQAVFISSDLYAAGPLSVGEEDAEAADDGTGAAGTEYPPLTGTLGNVHSRDSARPLLGSS